MDTFGRDELTEHEGCTVLVLNQVTLQVGTCNKPSIGELFGSPSCEEHALGWENETVTHERSSDVQTIETGTGDGPGGRTR